MDVTTAALRKRARSEIREWQAKYVNYLRLTSSVATSARYDQALERFFEHFKDTKKLRPCDFYRSDVEDYRIMRKTEGISNDTVNLEMAAGRGLFDFIIAMSKEPLANPFRNVKRLKVAEKPKRNMPLADVEKIMAVAVEDPYDLLLAMLAFQTGLRGEEMVLLDRDDFSFTKKLLMLPARKTKGKTKGREIPITDELIAAVRPFPGALFKGYARTAADIRYRWRRLCWKAEVKPVGLHSTRHTVATQLIRAGADLATVRDMLGHASIKTTSGYLAGQGAEEARDFLTYLPKPIKKDKE